MANDKMTKREMFTASIAVLTQVGVDNGTEAKVAPLVAGLQHEIDLLDKKRASGGKNTAKAKEQDALKVSIREVLDGSDEPMKATAIGAAVSVSVQRASALLRQMVEAGTVTRTEDKKEVFFS